MWLPQKKFTKKFFFPSSIWNFAIKTFFLFFFLLFFGGRWRCEWMRRKYFLLLFFRARYTRRDILVSSFFQDTKFVTSFWSFFPVRTQKLWRKSLLTCYITACFSQVKSHVGKSKNFEKKPRRDSWPCSRTLNVALTTLNVFFSMRHLSCSWLSRKSRREIKTWKTQRDFLVIFQKQKKCDIKVW